MTPRRALIACAALTAAAFAAAALALARDIDRAFQHGWSA